MDANPAREAKCVLEHVRVCMCACMCACERSWVGTPECVLLGARSCLTVMCCVWSQADGLILQVEYHLLDAAGRGNLEKAQQAAASGAPVNCSDAYKRTPLMIACCEGHKDLVVYLLQLGAGEGRRRVCACV